MAKIFIVDDDRTILQYIAYHLKKWGYDVHELEDGAALTPETVRSGQPDAVLIDIMMPGRSGIKTLKEIHPIFSDLPIVIMTAHGTIETAVEAMKFGAYDFLTKPIDPTRLEIVVKNAVKTSEMARRLSEYSSQGRRSHYCEMIGSHESLQKIYNTIDIVSGSSATVMITGESGTGKELIVRALHEKSGRKGRLVEVNCGAIPRDLMESELFGHEKGAFTGAGERRTGTIEMAEGGTLFLDEICELESGLQSKLLRFLQERYIQRVGNSEKIPVDTRVVAATKKDPLFEVREGRFRDDLYYRLNVIPIHAPPLRERYEDIPALARSFASGISEENHMDCAEIELEALSVLTNYSWPGNVRELKNTIERLVIMNRGKRMTAGMIPDEIRINAKSNLHVTDPLSSDGDTEIVPLEEVKKEVFARALRICDGNVVEAAKRLGIGYNTLYRKIKEFNLDI
jgi:two-component system, repressor protein LuxO